MDQDKTRPDQIMDCASYGAGEDMCVKCHKPKCAGCKNACTSEGGDVIAGKTH